jgi:hypothetical protein
MGEGDLHILIFIEPFAATVHSRLDLLRRLQDVG